MAVIRFDINYASKFVKDNDLTLLPGLGVQVKKNEHDIEFEITPDRPDLLSIRGIKRLVNVYKTGKPMQYKLASKKHFGEIIVEKNVNTIRPYIVGAVVKDVKFSEEDLKDLMQFQEKIHTTLGRKRRKVAIGIHDLSKITFPVRYCKMKLNKARFAPLHHKGKVMTALEIIQKTDKGREYAHLTKNSEGIFIKDSKGIIFSFPPIINAGITTVTAGHKCDLFIDMTGTDIRALKSALNILVTLLSEMNAKIYPVKVGRNIYPDREYIAHKIPYKYIETFVDIKLNKSKLKKLLNRMDWNVKGDKVYAQPYRADIISGVDIAEDVLIAYGFHNIIAEYPGLPGIGKGVNEHYFNNILTGLGFLEVKTWTLTNTEKLNKCKIIAKNKIKIINPLTTDFTTFRCSLMPGLMSVLAQSKKVSMPHKIYELGIVALPERNVMATAVCAHDADFSQIRSLAQAIIRESGENIVIKETDDQRFIKGRCAAFSKNNKILGVFGEVHPSIIVNWGIEHPVTYLETELW